MPDEPSLHDVLRGSLAHHAEQLGDPIADIGTVWSRVDHRRARRRGVAVVGSVAALAAGAAGIMLVADPTGSPAPLDGTDGSAPMSWRCTGPLGSDGTYEYFRTCEALPSVVTATTPPMSVVPSTVAASSLPATGTAPPTTAFSPFVSPEQVYVVVAGDSYYSITDRFGLEIDALHRYNGWPEGIEHFLVVGEQVLIPPSDTATATTVGFLEQRHVVAAGDTLAAIAEQYGVDVVTLANYNGWPEGPDHVIMPAEAVLIPPFGIGGAPGTLPFPTVACADPADPAGTIPCTAPPTTLSQTGTVGPVCTSSMGDIVVTVPCEATPGTDDLPAPTAVPASVVLLPAYRCSGPLGHDQAYEYYSSCELLTLDGEEATSTVMGTASATSTTTTTTTVAPTSAPPTTAPIGMSPVEQIYIVRPGDSISSISALFGIEMDTLVNYNGWTEGIEHPLVVDEEVKVPPSARIPDPLELGASTATTLPAS